MPANARFIRGIYLEDVQIFRRIARERLIPCLGNIHQEVGEITRQEEKRLGLAASGDEWADPAAISEAAYDNALRVGQTMWGLEEGLKALATAALFHLFEQQLQDLCRIQDHELGKGYVTMLKALGLEGFPRSEDLGDLSLIANVTKHGDGRSANELRERCPKLFVDHAFPESLLTLCPGLGAPLLGEGLSIDLETFDFYADLVEAFWTWVAEQDDRPSRREP